MKKTLLTIAILSSFAAHADNDVTNSNNTNTSTQSNEIIHNDSYDSHAIDSSTSTDASTDNSSYSHNNEGSYNQANQSWQTITNTNTEGDLQDSKNTGSYNTNSYNTDTSGSGNTLSSTATSGDSNANQHQGQYQGQGQGQQQGNINSIAGDTTQVKTGAIRVNTPVTISNHQVRQHRVVPFAFAPGMAMSFSQDNCSNSASLGVSTGIFGVSGGVPIGSDDCNRRKDVQMWLAVQQPRIACERMAQSEDNADAMKAAGLTCAQLAAAPVVAPVVVSSTLNVPSAATYDKWDRQNGIILDRLTAVRLSK